MAEDDDQDGEYEDEAPRRGGAPPRDGMATMSPEEAARLEAEEQERQSRDETPDEKKKRLKDDAKSKIEARLKEKRKLRSAMRGAKKVSKGK